MVDNKDLKYDIRRLKRAKTWQLVILLVLLGTVSATLLRLNNIGMVDRRAAVISADKQGDASKTKTTLYDLQRYVSSHMNTNMGKGVYLESTYRRDVAAAYAAASADTNSNGNIYKAVQLICQPQFPSMSSSYIQCVTDELAKYPAGTSPASSVQLPRADSYRHAFASPMWSPDFAGVSVLISVVILIMIIARATGVIILKMIIKSRNNRFNS